MPKEQDDKSFGELLEETLGGDEIRPIRKPKLSKVRKAAAKPSKRAGAARPQSGRGTTRKAAATRPGKQAVAASMQRKPAQPAPAPAAVASAKARPAPARKTHRAHSGTAPSGADTLTYRMPGVPEKQFRKWRDAARKRRHQELDLHGMKQEEAIRATKQFIDDLCRRGMDTGSVIHGKGIHSKDNKGVLKTAVRFRALRANPRLKAYFTAANGGATVIWLKTR